jgi:signal transduction histidine kinase
MQQRVKALIESSEFLQVVLQNITSAVMVLDKNLRIYHINDVAGLLFGQSTQDMVGKLFGNAVCCLVALKNGMECGKSPACKSCSIRNAILKVISGRRPVVKMKHAQDMLINGRHERKILQYSAKYIRFAGTVFVIIIMDDITEMDRQRSELERLNTELNKYVGIAAHDLRHPVSVVKMYSKLLLDTMRGRLSADERKFLHIISQKTEFMLAMLEGVLDTAKIEAGALELNMMRDDYIEFLKQIIEQNQVVARTKEIRISLQTPLRRIKLMFDKIRMEQVLNNLLHNAYKFSPEEADIVVSLEKRPEHLVTHVVDKGPGITPQQLRGIFNPFRSMSVQNLGQERSVGLGLAIVKKIVEAHGGVIHVTSKVKQGSDFYFSLPYKNRQVQALR